MSGISDPDHFEGEIDGDPFPFDPIDAELAQMDGAFGGSRMDAINSALMAGGLPLYDRVLAATEFCNSFMFTADSDVDPFLRVVVLDPSDGRFTVIRRTESVLEAKAFSDLIDIAGFHPNALPPRIH